jgi:aldose 1-epimerase
MRYSIVRNAETETFDLVDSESGSVASVAPKSGANLFRLRLPVAGKAIPVLLEPPTMEDLTAAPSRYGHPILFPFPNRIRDGKFVWKGKSYETPTNASGHAIHGYALRSAWRVTGQEANDDLARIVLEWRLSNDSPEHRDHWPADAAIKLTYTLDSAGLAIEAVVSNPDDVELPWGLGYHTYFRMPLTGETSTAQSRIVVPAARKWELEGFLPTGRKLPVPAELDLRAGLQLHGLKADDVLTDLEHGSDGLVECRLIDEAIGWESFMRTSPEFKEMVVFTPSWSANSIALEPYTQTTDAINLAARNIEGGLRVLAPGDSTRTFVRIGTRPVLSR